MSIAVVSPNRIISHKPIQVHPALFSDGIPRAPSALAGVIPCAGREDGGEGEEEGK